MKVKVKIISCDNSELWYSKMIGEILEVNKVKGYYGEYEYECKIPNENMWGIIHKEYVEEI